jgi:hypothetical protein
MVDRYKGRKISIVFPQEIYDVIEKLAESDRRTLSGMVVKLCEEALDTRNQKT